MIFPLDYEHARTAAAALRQCNRLVDRNRYIRKIYEKEREREQVLNYLSNGRFRSVFLFRDQRSRFPRHLSIKLVLLIFENYFFLLLLLASTHALPALSQREFPRGA